MEQSHFISFPKQLRNRAQLIRRISVILDGHVIMMVINVMDIKTAMTIEMKANVVSCTILNSSITQVVNNKIYCDLIITRGIAWGLPIQLSCSWQSWKNSRCAHYTG